MKKLKTLLKALAVFVLVLLVSVVGLGIYAIKNPEKVWQIVENHFLPKDLKVTWDDIDFAAAHQSGRVWNPEIDFKNLCIRKGKPSVDVCLDQLTVRSNLSLEEIRKPQFHIHSLLISSSYLNHFTPSKNEKEPSQETEENLYEMARDWQKKLKKYSKWIIVDEVRIAIDRFELRSAEGTPMVFKVSLESPRIVESAQLKLDLSKKPNLEFGTEATLSLQNYINGEGEILNAKMKAALKKMQAEVSGLQIKWDGPEILALIDADVKIPTVKLKNHLKLRLNEEALLADLKMLTQGLKKPLDQLKPIIVSLKIPQQEKAFWSDEKASFHVSAFLPMFFVDAKLRPRLEKSCRCQIPEEITANITGDGSIKRYLSEKDGELAHLQANLQNINNSLFNTRINAELTVDRKQGELQLFPKIDSKVVLSSFQGLAVLLKDQGTAIPAPLSELEGTVFLEAKGPVDRNANSWKIPYSAGIDLKSNSQKVDTTSQGNVTIDLDASLIDLNIDVLIRSIVLQLPPLDPIYGVPKIAPDKRFQVQPPKMAQSKKSKFRTRFALHVRSSAADSIRLLYPLAKPAVPMAVSLDYQTGSPFTGTVTLDTFKIEYLKRRSTIERFEFALNKPTGAFPVNARMRVDQFPYKIYVDILGNLKAPQIVLSSDPYLDRSDIISVLLYGRPNDQLVSADAKTVGSFNAAMGDRAVGLLGLWALSSTPIQSFSYNQLSKQYSAQLKLSDDTSLVVGTNWEQAASLEVQKRLSDHWMIDASLEPTEEEQQSRKLRLQWEDRF